MHAEGLSHVLWADARGKGRLLPVHAGRLAALTSLHLADSCAGSCWPAMCAYAKAETDQFFGRSGWRSADGGKRGGARAAAADPYAPIPGALAGLAALTGTSPALALCVSHDSHKPGCSESSNAVASSIVLLGHGVCSTAAGSSACLRLCNTLFAHAISLSTQQCEGWLHRRGWRCLQRCSPPTSCHHRVSHRAQGRCTTRSLPGSRVRRCLQACARAALLAGLLAFGKAVAAECHTDPRAHPLQSLLCSHVRRCLKA